MGVHDGHRERLRRRFYEHGLDSFDDHTALELLLCFAIPRRDVNPLAHELIEHFGGLHAVLDAPVAELEKMPGMGRNAAILLKLVPQMSRKSVLSKSRLNIIIDSTTAAGDYFVPFFMHERDEVVYLMCLDSKCKVTFCREMFRGTVNSAEVSIRKIVETALNQNATRVILAHNHTSGLAIPSSEDEMTTRRLKLALDPVGIALADHIIVAGEDYVSLAESGTLSW